MILKNRRTRKTLEIEYSEFRKKFAKEIQVAFDSYDNDIDDLYHELFDDFKRENPDWS